jgi:hypothetical protein
MFSVLVADIKVLNLQKPNGKNRFEAADWFYQSCKESMTLTREEKLDKQHFLIQMMRINRSKYTVFWA